MNNTLPHTPTILDRKSGTWYNGSLIERSVDNRLIDWRQ